MIKLAKTYRAGYWGAAFGVEKIHVTGFEGTQWFIQAGRKVWVFR